MRRRAAWIAAAALAAGAVAAQAPAPGSEAQLAAGKRLYEKYCAQCHGEAGDGKGVAAPRVKPKPRDFTAGKYKIRTTPSGALPTHGDLVHIIRVGMPYSSMPAWPDFGPAELDALAYYVKSFSEDFANPELVPQPIDISAPPKRTEESVALGREIYEQLGCAGCHGEQGRGDGPSAPTLRDDWGDHIYPADLTKRWTFRGGASRRDIFRAFSTGLNGTPMPSYYDALEEQQRWQLVDYIASLGSERPDYAALVTARPVRSELDLEQAEELFAGAPVARLPVIGQVVQPGREFHPACNAVLVRAVYNQDEIAIELRWNDMRAEVTGNNRPDLEVPRFEDDPARGAAPATEPAEDDFWGAEQTADEGDFWGEETAEQAEDFWGETEAAGSAAAPASEFSDAVAIQFPQQPSVGSRKPYFLFGDKQNPVDLWFLDLADAAPEQLVGRGSDALESQGALDLTAAASYDRGQWTVVFKRPLRSPGGASFETGRFVPIAVSVWDGFNRERGNKRGLTAWYSLYLDPGDRPSPVGPMIRTALIVLGIELLIVLLVRRRHARGARRTEPAVIEQRA